MSPLTTSEPIAHRRHQRWVLFLAIAFLVLGLWGGWVAIRFATGKLSFAPPIFHGLTLQSPEQVADFSMMSSTGETVHLADYRGRVTLLYFGYTFCPDVCPATLLELREARKMLGREADDIQVIMITVDPARDTPAKLQQYLAQFDDSFIGLSGTADELLAVSTQLGIYYQAREIDGPAEYLMDHTAAVLTIDKEGYLRIMYPFGVSGGDIAADLNYLIQE